MLTRRTFLTVLAAMIPAGLFARLGWGKPEDRSTVPKVQISWASRPTESPEQQKVRDRAAMNLHEFISCRLCGAKTTTRIRGRFHQALAEAMDQGFIAPTLGLTLIQDTGAVTAQLVTTLGRFPVTVQFNPVTHRVVMSTSYPDDDTFLVEDLRLLDGADGGWRRTLSNSDAYGNG